MFCRAEDGLDEDGPSKNKRFVIYEYELSWNDDEPIDYDPREPGEGTRLKLVG